MEPVVELTGSDLRIDGNRLVERRDLSRMLRRFLLAGGHAKPRHKGRQEKPCQKLSAICHGLTPTDLVRRFDDLGSFMMPASRSHVGEVTPHPIHGRVHPASTGGKQNYRASGALKQKDSTSELDLMRLAEAGIVEFIYWSERAVGLASALSDILPAGPLGSEKRRPLKLTAQVRSLFLSGALDQRIPEEHEIAGGLGAV